MPDSFLRLPGYLSKVTASGADLALGYGLVYSSAFNRLVNEAEPNLHYFRDWMRMTDLESDRHLRSPEFLDSLSENLKQAAELYSLTKGIAPHYHSLLSSLDDSIDQYTNAAIRSWRNMQEAPNDVIHRKEETRLLRYRGEPEHRTPLLVVYAPINRYHVMDIRAGRSIIEKFALAGFDVFLLDWGKHQKYNKPAISDYVEYIDRSVDEIRKLTKSESVSLLGYSWGGVLSIIYASLYGAKIKNLIIQSAPADFEKDDSILGHWMRAFPADEFANAFGAVASRLINLAFLMRNPANHSFEVVKYAAEMNDGPHTDLFEDLFNVATWLNDTTDIPAQLFAQFARDLYRRNLLIKGKMEIRTEGTTGTVELGNISVPLLNIVGEKDDLVPPASSTPLNDLVSGNDKTLVRFPTGHVELCIGSDAHEHLWPQAAKWLKERSQ